MDPLAAIKIAETANRFVRWCRTILYDTRAIYLSAMGQEVTKVHLAVIVSDLEQWSDLISQGLSSPHTRPGNECYHAFLADACHRLMGLADEIKRDVGPGTRRQMGEPERDMTPEARPQTNFQSAKTAFACLIEAVEGDSRVKTKRWARQMEEAHARLSQGLVASLWCVTVT